MNPPDKLLKSLEHLSAPQLRRLVRGNHPYCGAICRIWNFGWANQLALVVDFDDLSRLKAWMRNTQPHAQAVI